MIKLSACSYSVRLATCALLMWTLHIAYLHTATASAGALTESIKRSQKHSNSKIYFDAAYYRAKNPDVVDVYGSSEEALKAHYLKFGWKEGRSPNSTFKVTPNDFRKMTSFDAAYYRAKNPDVVDVYGSSEEALKAHYLKFGFSEGRAKYAGEITFPAKVQMEIENIKSSMDWSYYLNKYPDVRDVYGNSREGAIAHYLAHGFDEGRQIFKGHEPHGDDFMEALWLDRNKDAWPDVTKGLISTKQLSFFKIYGREVLSSDPIDEVEEEATKEASVIGVAATTSTASVSVDVNSFRTALSKEEIFILQQITQKEGLYVGKLDGIWGDKTRSAVLKWFKKHHAGDEITAASLATINELITRHNVGFQSADEVTAAASARVNELNKKANKTGNNAKQFFSNSEEVRNNYYFIEDSLKKINANYKNSDLDIEPIIEKFNEYDRKDLFNFTNYNLQSGEILKNNGMVFCKDGSPCRASYSAGHQLKRMCDTVGCGGMHDLSNWFKPNSPNVISFKGVTPFALPKFAPLHRAVDAMAVLNGFDDTKKMLSYIIENIKPSEFKVLGIEPKKLEFKKLNISTKVLEKAVAKQITNATNKGRLINSDESSGSGNGPSGNEQGSMSGG